MFCKKCGKKLINDDKICSYCGIKSSENSSPSFKMTKSKKSFFSPGRIIFIIIIIGFAIYGSLDDAAITSNDAAITSLDSGDTKTAIIQLEEAKEKAVTTETKIGILINLAYVQTTELDNQGALDTFNEALGLTDKNSFYYYLLLGEIAYLENKPDVFLLNFNKAYELEPNDFQLNNSLTLFYLDLEETWPAYEDYEKALSYAKKAYKYDTYKTEVSKQNLAIAHLFNENYDKSISLLSTTNLDQHPYMSYWLGLAYISNGDEINGRFYLQKAADYDVEMEQEIYDYLNDY